MLGVILDILGYYGGRGYLEQSGEEKRIGGYYLFIFVRIMCAYLLGNGSGGVSNSLPGLKEVLFMGKVVLYACGMLSKKYETFPQTKINHPPAIERTIHR